MTLTVDQYAQRSIELMGEQICRASLGLCVSCGEKLADHGSLCMDCDQLRFDELKDRTNKGE